MAINKRKVLQSAQKNLQKGALDKALKDYQTLLKADPKDSNVRLKIGDIHLKQGNTEEAVGAYLKVADRFMADGFDAKAVALYKQIVRIDEKRLDVYQPLAELYQRLGLNSDAMSALQTAADAHYREGNRNEALDLLRRMASLDPTNTANRMKVADLLRQEERTEEAIAEFEAVAEELERQNDREGRVKALERVVELDPARTEGLVALARAQLAAERHAVAEKTARALVKRDATAIVHQELLAEALEHSGQAKEARTTWQTVAALCKEAGDDARARDLMQRYGEASELGGDTDEPVLEQTDELAFGEGTDLGAGQPGFDDPGQLSEGLELGAPLETNGADEPALDISGPVGSDALESDDLAADDLASDALETDLDSNDSGPAPLLDDEMSPQVESAPAPAVDAGQTVALSEAPVADAEDADPDQLVAEASVLLRYQKHDRAIETLRRVLAIDPSHPGALAKLADAFEAAGDEDNAAEARRRLAEVAPAAEPAQADATPSAEPAQADATSSSDEDLFDDIDIDDGDLDMGSAPDADAQQTDVAAAPAAADDLAVDDGAFDLDESEGGFELGGESDLGEAADLDGSIELGDASDLGGATELGDAAELGAEDAAAEAAADLGVEDESPETALEDDAFDLATDVDLGADTGSEVEGDSAGASDAADSPAVAAAPDDIEIGFEDDFELGGEETDEGEAGPAVADASAKAAGELADVGLDFDLDVEPDAEPQVAPDPAAEVAASAPASESEASDEAPADAASDATSSGSSTTPQQMVEDLEEADFYFQQGLYEEARGVYERILTVAPAHPQAMLRLGEIEAATSGPAAAPVEPAALQDDGAVPSDATLDLVDASADPGIDLDLGLDEGFDPVAGPDADALAPEAPAAEPIAPEPDREPVQAEASAPEAELEPDPEPVAPEPEPAVAEPIVPEPEPALAEAVPVEPEPTPDAAPSAAAAVETEASDPNEDSGSFDLAAELSDILGSDDDSTSGAASGATEEEGFEQVFAAFKEGVQEQLGDGDHEAHYDLGIAYKEMGLFDDAIQEFGRAMASPDRALPCLHMMGLCALDLGRVVDAVAHLEQALALPDVPGDQLVGLRFDLGRAYAEQGDVERARAAFEAVIEADPEFGDAADRLAALDELSTDPGADLAGTDAAEAFESFDDLIDESDVTEPRADEAAEPEYESFDEFLSDDGDDDAEAPAQADAETGADALEPDSEAASEAVTGGEDAEALVAGEADAMEEAEDSEPELEAVAEATAEPVEAEVMDPVDADPDVEIAPEPPVDAASGEVEPALPDPEPETEAPSEEPVAAPEKPAPKKRRKRISFF